MKRIIKLIFVFLTVFMMFMCSSCVTMCMLQKKMDKEFYNDDSNYLQFTGVITEVVYFNEYRYGIYEYLFRIETQEDQCIGSFDVAIKNAPTLPERGYIAHIGDEVAFLAACAGGINVWSITEFSANGVCYITHEEGKAMKLATL